MRRRGLSRCAADEDWVDCIVEPWKSEIMEIGLKCSDYIELKFTSWPHEDIFSLRNCGVFLTEIITVQSCVRPINMTLLLSLTRYECELSRAIHEVPHVSRGAKKILKSWSQLQISDTVWFKMFKFPMWIPVARFSRRPVTHACLWQCDFFTSVYRHWTFNYRQLQ